MRFDNPAWREYALAAFDKLYPNVDSVGEYADKLYVAEITARDRCSGAIKETGELERKRQSANMQGEEV